MKQTIPFLPAVPASQNVEANSDSPGHFRPNSNQYFAIETLPTGNEPGASTYQRLAPVDVVMGTLTTCYDERFILRKAVSNLWSVYRYNQHYIGLLNGGVSEKDFATISEMFVKEPQSYSVQYLQAAAKYLMPLIGDDELTARDIATVLNAQPDQLELALESGQH